MKRKNIIRLSEAQLHNIIRESVKQVIRKTRLNEIGNTDDGAKALGALSLRNFYRDGGSYGDVSNDVKRRWRKSMDDGEIDNYIRSHNCNKEAVRQGSNIIKDRFLDAMETNLWDIERDYDGELPDDFDNWSKRDKVKYFMDNSDWTTSDWYAYCFGVNGDKMPY